MNFLIILKVAFRSLRRTLLRSMLTALGVIIGVAAVIALVSLGNGAKARMEALLTRMDTSQITLSASMPRDKWPDGMEIAVPPGDGLRFADYEAIRREIPGIAALTIQATGRGWKMAAYGRGDYVMVTGVDVGDFKLNARRVVRGSAFGNIDIRRAETVCLISATVAKTFFVGRDPIGRFARIQNTPFRIIGVLADGPSRDSARLAYGDTTVLIPFTSLLRRLDREAPLSIAIKPRNPADLGHIQKELSNLMERRRGARQAEFVTNNIEQMLEIIGGQNREFTRLLGWIAGISLVVGGIGIMNIMLVSVTERTREIGIRMAIGTRSGDILRQFLIESMILSMSGGMIGIVVGVGAAYFLTQLNDWVMRVTVDSVLGAFLCSAAIGIFFGYYPARRAALLDPIEALRAE